ncbi:hypothetical protein [Actinomadura sp. WMMB 499]|uniref:hypothetical protein n=1 Tax=Actinomadura sp. WMMB 499 TaxID=1219491 RepID=UPI001C3FF596|nr:hypothetical protein [Actinomadura sp. WMMB 499]
MTGRLPGKAVVITGAAGIPRRSRLGDVRAKDMARVHAVNVMGPLLGIRPSR